MTRRRIADQPRQYWSTEQLEELRRLYPDLPTAEVARQLGRSLSAVYGAAGKLGLHKSEVYLASPAACRLRRGDNVGAACRFLPGHVPANKGLRRPGWAPGRMAATQFRKGERRGAANRNWRPVGTILVDHEGYRRIKVREALPGEAYGFGNVKVWPLLQRHVWTQQRGPIPPGHTVCFKDGDRAHCDIDNLELVSRADLARRNSMWNRLPRELAEVIQLRGALNRKLRRLDEKQNVRSAESPVRDAGSAQGCEV